MWLEPVAERPPQHASRRARRSPLHDVVLSIEEIRRVPGIKRHRSESGKWLEFRARPFPAVAHDILNAKSARPAWIRSHRTRIPMRKIKISVPRFGRFLAPWIISLHFRVRSAVRRAMKLLLGWQLASKPLAYAVASAWLTYTGQSIGSRISPNIVRYNHRFPARRQKAGCCTPSFFFQAHASLSHSEGSEYPPASTNNMKSRLVTF